MHTNVPTLNALRDRMQRHNSVDIASASGVHINTVRRIRNGLNLNPTIGIVQKISDAVDSMEGVEND